MSQEVHGASIRWPVPRSGTDDASVIVDIWHLSETHGVVAIAAGDNDAVHCEDISLVTAKQDRSGRLWPGMFDFNPWTGDGLSPIDRLLPGGGRFGTGSSLPITTTGRTIDPAGKRQEPLEQGNFYFAIGGDPGHLCALDASTGTIWRKSRIGGHWSAYRSCGRSHFPPWANALAATSTALFYSTADALAKLDRRSNDENALAISDAIFISAPAVIGDGIAVPYRSGNLLGVAWLGPHSQHFRKYVASAPRGEGIQPDILAAPVVRAGNLICWIGRDGYLAFEMRNHLSEATWQSWPAGFEAKPFLFPFRSPNGQLWAFGTHPDDGDPRRSRPAMCAILDGENPALHILEGPHASCGNATYRLRERHALPWDKAVETLQISPDYGDRWVLPIASLGGGTTIVALVEHAATMLAFLFREGTAPKSAIFYMHVPNGGLTSMQYSAPLKSTDDIDVFEYAGRLHLYHRDRNECVSWPLL